MLRKKLKFLIVICIIVWQALHASDEKLLAKTEQAQPGLAVSIGITQQKTLNFDKSPAYIDGVGYASWNHQHCSLFVIKEAKAKPCKHNPGHILDEQKRKFLHPELSSTNNPKLYVFPFNSDKTVVFTEQHKDKKRTFRLIYSTYSLLRVETSSKGQLIGVPTNVHDEGPCHLTGIGFLSWTETCITLCQIDTEQKGVITCDNMHVLDDFLPKELDPARQPALLYVKTFDPTSHRVFFDYPNNSTVYLEPTYPDRTPPPVPTINQKKAKPLKTKGTNKKNQPNPTPHVNNPYPKWKTVCFAIFGLFVITMLIRYCINYQGFSSIH